MENALYYTLSTIAQALAAAFALLGAFVLFRLQQIASNASAAASVVVRPYLPNQEARRLLALGKFEEFVSFLETQKIQVDPVSRPHTWEAACEALNKAVSQRSSLLNNMLFAMLATGIAITLCVVGLAVTPKIVKGEFLDCIVLFSAIVVLVVCLVSYGRIIWSSTNGA